jgi:DNA processing protein
MDKELLSYALLLQGGFTHKEMKDLLFNWENTPAHTIWENAQNWKFPPLADSRVEKLKEKIRKIDEAQIRITLEKYWVDIVTQKDPRYPKTVKSIGHSPAFFYLRWTLNSEKPLLWVVWSRKNTQYAERILERILPDIVQIGIGIVSWWASWVDSLAHEICMITWGYTIVVIWTGIDICYPEKNAKLFMKVIESWGALISQFPLSTGPEQYNFPMRNELVAALSKGVIIPEAWLSSWTLITAQLALEHGRDVFAVPGDIDRLTSEGTNMLIATGQAKCVRCSGDILEEYFDIESIGSGMTPIIKPTPIFEWETEKIIYESIKNGNKTIDELLLATGITLNELITHASLLEIHGHISIDLFGKYQIN